MTTFVALYRGQTVGDARLIAVSADPELVGAIASRLAGETRAIAPVRQIRPAGARHEAPRTITKRNGSHDAD